jgi:tRNA 5-methylaminomethyl-2-thiouridine biosynthesis bifunctional protein
MTQNAKLAWQNGQPFSEAFGDVYFSRDSGLEETRHVFLQNNQLPQRFASLTANQLLTIGETGFGTGLNFLCAWQCFRQQASAGARLHFVSVEKYPLLPQDLQQALALWPELAELSAQLCAQYSALPPGWHRFHFDGGRITLTLIIGDALEVLPRMDMRVDAWFLDGFSPAKNPDMWSDDLFQAMASRSAQGATFSTFTCAGFVRRGLKAAGFQVEKTPGFGSKREMSRGVLLGEAQQKWSPPWYTRPAAIASQRSALVIGGGLAGASAAYSLAIRGWSVTLIERNEALAQEASGNAQGILYARFSAHRPLLTQFAMSGYLYSLRLLQQLLPRAGDGWHQCGVLQLPVDDNERRKQQALLDSGFARHLVEGVDQQTASRIAGIALPQGGLFFPQGGWVRPGALVEALCAHPDIQLRTCSSVLELAYNATDRQWLAIGASGPVALGEVVILAGAADSAGFDSTGHLPLKKIRGQITSLPATDHSRALQTVVCQQGYIAPARQDQHCLGASFVFNAEQLELSAQEHRSNLEMLRQGMPDIYQAMNAEALDVEQLEGRAAFRCVSPDYLPLAGPVAAASEFAQCYRALSNDATLQLKTPAPRVPGLYITTAHGSRGLISAPLCGEILAAEINGEPAPLDHALMEALHPARFLVRDLIRSRADFPHSE